MGAFNVMTAIASITLGKCKWSKLELLYIFTKAEANSPKESIVTNPFRKHSQNVWAWSMKSMKNSTKLSWRVFIFSVAGFFSNKVLKRNQNLDSIKTTCFISLSKCNSFRWYGYVSLCVTKYSKHLISCFFVLVQSINLIFNANFSTAIWICNSYKSPSRPLWQQNA